MLQELFGRVRRLLLTPNAEWDAIDTENVEPQRLITHYVAPLVAASLIATLIGLSFIGASAFGVTVRMPLGAMIGSSIVNFVLMIASVFGFAFIINMLAPTFAAQQDFNQALKVSAYAPTAAWVAGLFTIIPALSALALVGGLYSLYLLFIGLPKLMKAPEDRSIVYTLVSIVAWIIVAVAVGLVANSIVPRPSPGSVFNTADVSFGPNNDIDIPVSPSDDANFESYVSDLEAAAEAGDIGGIMSALGGATSSGETVDADALRDLAPQRLSGLNRQSIEVQSLSFPVQAVTMEARYGEGDEQFTVTVTNSPAISAVIGISGMAGAEYDRRSDDGYERLSRDNDGLVLEEWSKSDERGRYGRMVADAFLIETEGYGVSMNDLRRATEAFSEDKLLALPTRE